MSHNYETFFASQCMFVSDQITLKLLDINESVVVKFGLERDQILGKKLADFGELFDAQEALNDKRSEKNSSSKQIWKFKIDRNEEFFLQFSSHLINYKGRPSNVIVGHEVFPKNSKREVSSPVEFLNFPLAEIEWNKDLEVVRWSRKAEELFGWTQTEVKNDDDLLKKFVHPHDLTKVKDQLSEAIRVGRNNVNVENRNLTKTGELVYCEWHNSILFDSEGELVSLYSLVVDVTQRTIAMEKSNRNQQSFRDLFDSISDAIYLIDEAGEILSANKGTELTFGYKVESLIGKNYNVLSAPGKFDPSRLYEIKKKAGLRDTSLKYDGFGRRNNGEVFPSEILVNTGVYFDKEVLIIIERDVSDRKLAEQELKKREHLLSELFNTSPLGIALLNQHNEVIEINKGFTTLFEYEYEDIVGLELDRVIVPSEFLKGAKKLSKTPYVTEKVTKRKKKSGELIDVIIYAVPIIIDGKMIFKYGIYVDISERKRSEGELRKSLKEKEVLLAEIHHRVKNNLAVISGLLELQSYDTDNEGAQSVLRESQMRIHSIALVHEKLYDNENFSEIKIKEYIKDLSNSVEKTMEMENIPVKINHDLDDVSLVLTQAISCGLLLNEVLTNSFKHAFIGKEDGIIDISFKKVGDFFLFSIEDNGIGMGQGSIPKKRSSLGRKLIKTLSKQLNAEMNVNNEKGTHYQFKFKK